MNIKNSNKYKTSNKLLRKANKLIPLGTQTFSKSFQQFPINFSPLFLKKGKGCHVWDVDGNKYIDLMAGLLPVLLGYQDKDVDLAIKKQLKNGISLSLATELEIQLSELLVDIIPCAEQVRLGKNGSDATTACIRIARAYTKRDRLIICGYHGWHDWYIASTVRNKGVPKHETKLSDRVPYNDLDSVNKILKKYPSQISALIMEPASVSRPNSGYFQELKKLLHKHGTLLIFDEIVTGFRFSLGGAQKLFNVTPDLAAFGKAMGNGMPISAVVGKKKFMNELEEIFFSTTFGGETLSIAAAIAVIKKLKSKPVIKTIWKKGKKLSSHLNKIIEDFNLTNVIKLNGLDPWKILEFNDYKNIPKEYIKTFVIKEMLSQGILVNSSHNIMYSLTDSAIKKILVAYKNTFSKLIIEIKSKKLIKNLNCPPIQPVFSIRDKKII